jgi:L-amino acid N-acyltransferase YncA
VEIRPATTADAEAIRAIYNHEVTTALTVFDMEPRSLEEQEAWLTERSGARGVIVATGPEGEVLGFASLSPYRPKPGYNTTVENSIYVDREARGQGVGAVLLDALIELGRDHGFHCIICHISGGNDASVALHRSAGFEMIGVEREVGRKFGRWLDVTVMQLLL